MSREQHYDVIIIGTGLAGTTLASILARQGHSVLMLEKGKHPRFAIGEATLPLGSLLLWAMGDMYGVPELQHLSSVDAIHEHITKVCGQKRTLGFVHHVAGQPQDVRHVQKTIPPLVPMISESHLYREHVDVYVLQAAQSYGAHYRDQTTITDIAFADDGVQVRTQDGDVFAGRYLVDAAGYRSPVATQLGLRDETPRVRVHSRSIFTHVTNLRPYDDLLPDGAVPALSQTMHHGTLHHVFDGGWTWVIPFGNHPHADSEIASVGIMLDPRRFPRNDALTPEQEFWAHVERYPGLHAHLSGIQPIRPWIRTDRVQYSSSSSVGERWCLLSHASMFVDPIFSQGLIVSIDMVRHLVPILLHALETDDFSAATFAPLQRLHDRQLATNDRMCTSAYRAMADFSTWNAWLHVWIANEFFGFMTYLRGYFKFLATQEPGLLSQLGADSVLADDIDALAAHTDATLARFERGELTADQAAQALYTHLSQADWLPHDIWGWGDADTRHLDMGPMDVLGQLIMWGKTQAPERMRTGLFDFPPPGPPPGAPPSM